MAYIIDEDVIEEGEMNGHWWSKREMTKEHCDKICKHKIRLLDDDDDEVYFLGRSSDSSSFASLDGFGAGYGCTSIQYFENGKWEYL